MLAAEADLAMAETSGALSAETLGVIRAGFASRLPGEQIAAAVELRAQLARDYDVERLRPLVDHLQERLTTLEGPGAAAAADQPADGDERSRLLGRALSLLERLKLSYSFISERDAGVDRIRRWCLAILGLMFLVLLVVAMLWNAIGKASASPSLLLVVNSALNYGMLMAVAAAGAVVSIMQRTNLQAVQGSGGSDPVAQISALRQGVSGVLVAGLVGPTLAVLLVPIFAGGVLNVSGLTPAFEPSCAGGGGPMANFKLIDHCVSLKAPADAARLVVWAFLAGFAERLVPDVLDRLVAAARAPKG
jgi:hypothetical protein